MIVLIKTIKLAQWITKIIKGNVVKRRTILVLLNFFLVFGISCAGNRDIDYLSKSELAALKPGMSREEVIKITGSPVGIYVLCPGKQVDKKKVKEITDFQVRVHIKRCSPKGMWFDAGGRREGEFIKSQELWLFLVSKDKIYFSNPDIRYPTCTFDFDSGKLLHSAMLDKYEHFHYVGHIS